jgi:hypothetical protein
LWISLPWHLQEGRTQTAAEGVWRSNPLVLMPCSFLKVERSCSYMKVWFKYKDSSETCKARIGHQDWHQ